MAGSITDLLSQLLFFFSGFLAHLPSGPYKPNGGGNGTFPAPGRCTGACTGVHDPAVVRRDDGTWFRFQTHDKIRIATAPSIQGPWTERGAALPNGSVIDLPGKDDLWCPDVFFSKPTYYLFYAVSQSGSQRSDIGVATSPSMDQGSWTDYGSLGIPDSPTKAYNKIDPNLLLPAPAPSGSAPPKFLLTFGSYWHDLYQVPLDSPPMTVATASGGGSKDKVAAPDGSGGTPATPVNVEFNGTESGPMARPEKLPAAPSEGAYQFWWGVGGINYYYLFFSSGSCCDFDPQALPPAGEEYKVMVCRSTKPDGDFVDRQGKKCTEGGGTLVLGSSGDMFAPGGQGVLFNKDMKSPVIYYHYINKTLGYENALFQFGWNKLDFKSGWPMVVHA